MAAIKKRKRVEQQVSNLRAVFLHPGIRRHLVGHLFVKSAGVVAFRELMGHGATEDNTARHATVLDVDEDAEIEASLEPLFKRKNRTLVARLQLKTVPDCSPNQVLFFPKLASKGARFAVVLKCEKKVGFLGGGRLETAAFMPEDNLIVRQIGHKAKGSRRVETRKCSVVGVDKDGLNSAEVVEQATWRAKRALSLVVVFHGGMALLPA